MRPPTTIQTQRSMEKVTSDVLFLIKIQISIIYSNHRHLDQMVLSHQLKYDFHQCNSIQLKSLGKSSTENAIPFLRPKNCWLRDFSLTIHNRIQNHLLHCHHDYFGAIIAIFRFKSAKKNEQNRTENETTQQKLN